MYKVMVIDDEDNLRQALEQLLVSNGYAFCGARAVSYTHLTLPTKA